MGPSVRGKSYRLPAAAPAAPVQDQQDQRFDSEADAETHGVRMAREWIDQNMPMVA